MSKQERVVCAGAKVKFIKHFRGKPNNENITKEVIFPMISRNQEDHIVQVDTMLELSGGEGSDRFSKMSTQYGFITNKNRFVDPVEAMRVSANNDNRVDKGIYKEIGRLRKELAKAYSKRNGGQIGVEVSLNILQTKYSELEESLNEFRSRDYLLPGDLY